MNDALEASRHGEIALASRKCKEALPQAERLGTPERLYETLAVSANSARQAGDCHKAVLLYKRAISIYRKSGSPGSKAESDKEDLPDLLSGLGESLLSDGASSSASRVLQEAFALLKPPSPFSEQKNINVLASMRWGHTASLLGLAYLSEEKVPEAVRLYEDIASLLPFENVSRQDLKTMAAGITQALACQRQHGEAENSKLSKLRKQLITSLRVARQSSSIAEELVHSWNGSADLSPVQVLRLASFHKKTRDYASAEKILRQGLEQQRKATRQDPRLAAQMSADLASLLEKKGNYQEAEQLMLPIVERIKKEPDAWDISDRVDMFWRLGDTYTKQGKHKEAEGCFVPILDWELNKIKRHDDEMAIHCRELANCLSRQEKWDEAVNWYRKALKFVVPGERLEENALLYYKFAQALKAKQSYKEARTYYRKAADIYEQLENSEEESKCRNEDRVMMSR